MFLPGIGGHLTISHIDPWVCFGNPCTNLSVRKSFLPFYIKSSHPNLHLHLQSFSHLGQFAPQLQLSVQPGNKWTKEWFLDGTAHTDKDKDKKLWFGRRKNDELCGKVGAPCKSWRVEVICPPLVNLPTQRSGQLLCWILHWEALNLGWPKEGKSANLKKSPNTRGCQRAEEYSAGCFIDNHCLVLNIVQQRDDTGLSEILSSNQTKIHPRGAILWTLLNTV